MSRAPIVLFAVCALLSASAFALENSTLIADTPVQEVIVYVGGFLALGVGYLMGK